ncbi:MAG: hypothetical protein KDN22_15140 [Verrucomicrobiae bacterium]|nr:hypothetical protein [Verrucomicrobiae bacterium]
MSASRLLLTYGIISALAYGVGRIGFHGNLENREVASHAVTNLELSKPHREGAAKINLSTQDGTFAWYLDLARIEVATNTRDFVALFDTLTKAQTTSSREAVDILLRRWIELNSMEALQHCERHPDSWYIRKLAAVWAMIDYSAALTAIDTLPEGSQTKNAFVTSLIGSLARANSNEALTEFKKRAADDDELASYVFKELGKEDLDLALSEAAKLPNRTVRNSAMRAVAKSWAEADPGDFIDKFSRWPKDQTWDFLDDSLPVLTRHDPQTVADLLGREALRSDHIAWRRFVQEWARADPEAALEFAEGFDPKSRERMLEELAGSLYRANPELGNRALMELKDPEKVADIFYMWSAGEWDKAAELAIALDAPAHRSAATAGLLKAMGFAYGNGRSLQADQWLDPLLELATGAGVPIDFDSVLHAVSQEKATEVIGTYQSEIIEQLALGRYISLAQDPADAASIIETFPDSVGRDKAIANLASTWSEADPTAAAQWLADLPDSEGKTMGFRRVASEWARHDLEPALNWIQKQEPSPARDAATRETAQVFALQDGQRAYQIADAITDESVRNAALTDVLKIWVGSDFQNAVPAIADLDLNESVRIEISRTIEEESQWRSLEH